MNKAILHKEVQCFIKYFKGSLSKLALSGSPFADVTTIELIQQIESRNTIEKKLPTWFNNHRIYYPPKLNLEQTSSEVTANYKASLFHGTKIADLTAGFGVDSYYFSKNFREVHCFEKNQELSAISEYNFKAMDASNITCFPRDGFDGIANTKYDVIYIDPSRRHSSKGKVFYLKDCEPNVTDNIQFLLDHADTILIKTSPMLDITQGLKELSNVSEIHIVAVGNDVKELLWILKDKVDSDIEIVTVNFTSDHVESFNFNWRDAFPASYSEPKQFLYSPNAAIMKSGAFEIIADRFGLFKLHRHTHLYTSNTRIEFPGRRFRIENVFPYSKKVMKRLSEISKANVATRNFPETVAVIRKKWKLGDGGDTYLFFTTIENEQKVVLVCSKV